MQTLKLSSMRYILPLSVLRLMMVEMMYPMIFHNYDIRLQIYNIKI